MTEVSNKLLASLLLVAIVVSVMGSYITLRSLGKAGFEGFTPTGAVTSSGTGRVNVSVVSTVSIAFTQPLVDFGSGYVNTSNCGFCEMDTYNHTNITNIGSIISPGSGCCISATAAGWPSPIADGLWLENTGNTYLNLNLTVNVTAATFMGGTNPVLQLNLSSGVNATRDSTLSPSVIDDDTEISCQQGDGWKNNGSVSYQWADITNHTSTMFVCGNASFFPWNYTASKNEVEINFLVRIPANALSGEKAMTVTATASNS